MVDCSNRGFDHIPHLSNLTEGLDLSGNKLSFLDKSSFFNLPNLQSLNLNWNEIKFIGKDTFSGLPSLQDLSLGHNHINIVQQTFSQIRFTLNTKLKYLDLSFNVNLPLDAEALYPDSVFASLMSLQELHVDLLPNPIFGTGFGNMTKLNKLVFKDCLYILPNLTDIDLRNNKITYLRKKARTWLDLMNSRSERNIRILMYGNPFACTCDTMEFVFWICDTSVMLDHHNNYTCVLPNGSIAILRHVNDNYQLFLGNCNQESFSVKERVNTYFQLTRNLVTSTRIF
ncbi:trophoblast glycoprotein-like [Mizuhopecten yessoensis]|uniref:trophoblast glycoprotein-like n=1 Tax=Mizuhopecten yessoensis TaxID=6573 RepID=UPI000B45DD36|nr:trophoblast glycoprotein-like [Mizuhopecten yessoensis]